MEDRREAIIEAAVELGSQQGLAAISARGVARKAGVSVGYLYKLFPSKSDIVVAFTLKSIVSSIQAGKNGCAVLLALLERGLY